METTKTMAHNHMRPTFHGSIRIMSEHLTSDLKRRGCDNVQSNACLSAAICNVPMHPVSHTSKHARIALAFVDFGNCKANANMFSIFESNAMPTMMPISTSTALKPMTNDTPA
jgi:hypothetical protein